MKKRVLPIILTVVAILVICLTFYYMNKPAKSSDDGEITIILLDKEFNELSKKNIKFVKGDSLFGLLQKNYDIIEENGMILKIDNLEAYDTAKEFIKIYINCDASYKGVKLIVPKDGNVYRFIIEITSSNGSLNDKFC